MKKTCLLSLALFLVLALTACTGPRTAVTADEFSARMRESGYEINDVTAQYNGDVDAAVLAFDQNAGYQIEFFVMPSVQQAVDAYRENKSDFEAEAKGTFSSNTTLEISNYSVYTLAVNNNYYVVSRTDNTMIFVKTTTANRDAVNKALKSIGY